MSCCGLKPFLEPKLEPELALIWLHNPRISAQLFSGWEGEHRKGYKAEHRNGCKLNTEMSVKLNTEIGVKLSTERGVNFNTEILLHLLYLSTLADSRTLTGAKL